MNYQNQQNQQLEKLKKYQIDNIQQKFPSLY
jgi:hypothetical protein